MSDVAIGLAAGIGALVLVGSGLMARGRRGEPIGHHALIWVAIFGTAFVVAWLIGRE